MPVVTKRIAEPQDDEPPSVLFSIRPHEEDVSQSEVAQFVDELRHARLRVGIIVTPAVLVVVQQTGWEGSLRAYQASEKLSTADIFTRAGVGPPTSSRLERQFFEWVRAVQQNWIEALSPDAAPVLLPNVVGGLLGSHVAILEG
ncbi:MAG: hypothetical protein HYV07_13615 [Deltaproteobacteria bacterium]|nr:hypothetical protein [Deltaproteobacteria bacterium]